MTPVLIKILGLIFSFIVLISLLIKKIKILKMNDNELKKYYGEFNNFSLKPMNLDNVSYLRKRELWETIFIFIGLLLVISFSLRLIY